jgi:chemotaxis family two-component system response regulator Rcp1
MNTKASGAPTVLLLAEDNPGDIRLTLEALKDVQSDDALCVVRDGVEALTFLRQEGQYVTAPNPNLILLDLNMPKMDGYEVLTKIKSDEKLRRIPVIILTTSQAEQDIVRSYDLHANCYVVKPVDLDQFIEVIKAITEFWLGVAELPQK